MGVITGTEGDDALDIFDLIQNPAYNRAGGNILNLLGGKDFGALGKNDTVYGGAGNDMFDAFSASGQTLSDGGTGLDVFVMGYGYTDFTFIGGAGGNYTFTSMVNGVTSTHHLVSTELLMVGVGILIRAEEFNLYKGADGWRYIHEVDETKWRAGETALSNMLGSSYAELNPEETFFQENAAQFSGDGAANNLIGGVGNDTIQGWGGADTMHGLGGHDSILAGDGNDYLWGGDNNDSLKGEAGNDSVYGGAGADSIWGGAGDDFLQGNQGDDAVSAENGGNDTLRGGQGNDLMHGGTGNSLLFGDKGDDAVFGYEGDEVIHGGKGNDEVAGGAGNDTVYGDLGNDTLSGGHQLVDDSDADLYVFGPDSGMDTIRYFLQGVDKLQLSSQIFSNASEAAAAFSGGVLDLGGGNSVTLTGLASLEASDIIIS